MVRKIHRLTTRQVMAAKPGRLSDGAGVYLIVTPSLNRKFVFRFTWEGKPREHGLGGAGLAGVSLAEARQKAGVARRLVASGINPIEAKRAAKHAPKGQPTFGRLAAEYIASKSPGWSEKHHHDWVWSLGAYAKPIWDRPINEIDTKAVLATLSPIWQRVPETASRVRGRIEMIIDYARAHGHIHGDRSNPAAWRGHLASILPGRKTAARTHFAAMPFQDVPELVRALRERQSDSMPAASSRAVYALELTILTAARSGMVLGMTWGEVDLQFMTWTVPGRRMKACREFRIPLSTRAVEILAVLHAARAGSFDGTQDSTGLRTSLVFPGRSPDAPLGPTSMRDVMRAVDAGRWTVHGLRSAFRDWCAEIARVDRATAELCLAHATGNAVEQAYFRSDVLERRRTLMQAWADYCGGAAAANVVPLRA